METADLTMMTDRKVLSTERGSLCTVSGALMCLGLAWCVVLLRPIMAQDVKPGLDGRIEEMKPEMTEVWEPEPRVVVPGQGSRPPSDAIVLFDGKDLAEWTGESGPAGWRVADGVMTVEVGAGGIRTKRSFGDVQLHIEWRTPVEVKGEGQGRGNSGVFLMGLYEVQVLDSYKNRTYSNGQAGSIYKQYMPLVNASLPPGEWQTYDIVFRRPLFNGDGSLARPAIMTVFHNGVLIQDHAVLSGPTQYIGMPSYERHDDRLPLMLQDHGNPVSYRNIWIREL